MGTRAGSTPALGLVGLLLLRRAMSACRRWATGAPRR